MWLKNILKREEHKFSNKEILRWLLQRWKGNLKQASLNALIGILKVAFSLVTVWAVQHAIDVATGSAKGSLYLTVGLMALLVVLRFVLSVTSVWIANLLGIRATNRMQRHTLDRLLRSEWLGNERRHSGDIINRLDKDVSVIVTFLTETIPSILSTAILLVGSFLYLFQMDRILALITIVVVPFFLILSKLYVRNMRRLTRSVRDSSSKVQSIMTETVQNQMLIKTLEYNDEAVGRIGGMQDDLQHKIMDRTRFSVFSRMITTLGFSFSYLFAFLWAAVRLSHQTITFGQMSAFLQLVTRIQTPMNSLMQIIPSTIGVLTAAERLMELEEIPLEQQGENKQLDSACGVRFQQVDFTYDEKAEKVIKNFSFDFKPGTCTAILGETGVGKTTLIRLILALISPSKGKATVYNRHEEHPLSPQTRCNFVYVPQGNTLLSGTIRENLCLGKPNATEKEMREALEKSCATFVFNLPQGLDTPCNERGGGLSEGQAQRIAIARALIRNKSIMLFDEATSALDPETECKLLKNIMENDDKTIIFITHRKAVLEFADQTLEMESINNM